MNAMRNQIKIPLFLSFYLLVFLAVPSYGNVFQLLSLALIVIQNIATSLNGSRNRLSSFRGCMTFLSIFLIAIIPLLSIINNFFNFEPYYVQYSILFFFAVFSIYFAVSTIEFRIIFNSFRYAAVAITLTILFTKSGLLLETLAISYDPVNGLNRFGPFGLHPNLVGHIFGGFAVMFFCTMLYEQAMVRKAFFASLTGISFLFCIAASSRGGFVAGVAGIAAVYSIAAWQDKAKRQYLLLFLLLALFAVLLTKGGGKLIDYLASIFEFHTGDRGVGSGLTGRTENWDKLLHTVFSSVTFMLFGNGLRTGSAEVLGYDIDNSYLNLLYEIGLPCTALFVMLVVGCTNRLRKGMLQAPDSVKAVAVGMFVFILFESVVARYLLSIGNPVSLFILYCMLGFRNILKSAPIRVARNHEVYYQVPGQYLSAHQGVGP
jgi:O-antigen ligase